MNPITNAKVPWQTMRQLHTNKTVCLVLMNRDTVFYALEYE